jgi:hypothetical protein
MNPASQDRFVEYVGGRWPDIELYIPAYLGWTRPHGLRHGIRVIRPYFPGYVFARPDLVVGEHINLRRTPVRAWYVRFGRWIEVVPDRVIEELRDMIGRGELEGYGEMLEDRVREGQPVVVNVNAVMIRGIVLKLLGGGGRAEVDAGFCRVIVPVESLERAS